MTDDPRRAAASARGRPAAPARERTRPPDVLVRRYALVPLDRLSLDVTARRSGLHPDLVRRMAALGVVDAARDAGGRLWFSPDAPAALARAQRLRAGLHLNYAAVGVVMDLLERIGELEAELRRSDAGCRSDESWI
ncbi:chaperone modulator CbpM [Streptomyces sp. TS71-3]|uniref:chaperone modulator CbpM n=1 Tax=Streptomyces sp. TS71-3 TaxID=2733862 RepID=UPI001B0D8606|nr:chaperone modulator CbpM [Streptomyces sp. TS71-3]GHJ42575.1 hypothetical protein Sm713_81840 [Streptomyces sp. TS71-3]